MRPLTWALKEVDPVDLHRQSTLSLCLESLRNRTPSNLKLDHISKNPSYKKNLTGRWDPLANGGTPKHNGKSGTADFSISRSSTPTYKDLSNHNKTNQFLKCKISSDDRH